MQYNLPLVDENEFYLVIKKTIHEEEHWKADDDSWGMGEKEKIKTSWIREDILGYADHLHEIEVHFPKFNEIAKKESSSSNSWGLKNSTTVIFRYQKIKRFDPNKL